jgi:hypothetical protein
VRVRLLERFARLVAVRLNRFLNLFLCVRRSVVSKPNQGFLELQLHTYQPYQARSVNPCLSRPRTAASLGLRLW